VVEEEEQFSCCGRVDGLGRVANEQHFEKAAPKNEQAQVPKEAQKAAQKD